MIVLRVNPYLRSLFQMYCVIFVLKMAHGDVAGHLGVKTYTKVMRIFCKLDCKEMWRVLLRPATHAK